MKPTDLIKAPSPVTCPCGGTWYDKDENPNGTVAVVKHKREPGYWAVCTRCGQTGQRGRTQAEAVSLWKGHCYKYEPLEESTCEH